MSEPTFARILAATREAQGLSQTELAKAAQIDRTLISRLERGARLPSAEVLERLYDTLGIDLTSVQARGAVVVLSGTKNFQG